MHKTLEKQKRYRVHIDVLVYATGKDEQSIENDTRRALRTIGYRNAQIADEYIHAKELK